MRNHRYDVTFETGKVVCVRASGLASAKILAQADQIEKGNEYVKVDKITRLKD